MLLEIKDIRFSFSEGRGGALPLLNGVSLGVGAGKVTALVGGNGTGKTTLFNIISGFETRYEGSVRFDGRDLSGLSPHRIARLGIGRLFQGGQLPEGLSLLECMKLSSDDRTGERPFESLLRSGRVREREEEKEAQAREILTRVFGEGNKYLGMLGADASGFSYGEQRLLSLSCLLMGRRRLLLLDEPTSGVNPVYVESIGKIIRTMVETEGLTVLLIEHNMPFVRTVADTCAFLDGGVISMTGLTAEVLDDRNVINSYLGV